MPLKVKICGITNATDALAAVEAGADALGFVFAAGSPRTITSARVAQIIARVPALVAKVGVFVDPSADFVRGVLAECELDVLQFHGKETPVFCRQFGRKVIKAARVQGAASLQELAIFDQEVWLLDSYVPGASGGTGASFNWELACEATRQHRWVMLAGGLTPENVGRAINQVRPYGVDVSSGVEQRPGEKDAAKIRRFIREARAALSPLDAVGGSPYDLQA